MEIEARECPSDLQNPSKLMFKNFNINILIKTYSLFKSRGFLIKVLMLSVIGNNNSRYVDALNELDVKRYKDDAKMTSLLKQFERYSHTDLTDEIKSLKVMLYRNCLAQIIIYFKTIGVISDKTLPHF